MSQESGRQSTIEEEISPLQYARQNGIAIDHNNDPVRAISNVYNMIMLDAQQDLFKEPDIMPSFDFGPPFLIKERLPLTKEAALAISDVSRVDAHDLSNVTLASLLDSRRAKKMKLEVPLLDDDEELTFKLYKADLKREPYETLCAKLNIPEDEVDDEKDQGMGWPSRYRELGPAWMKIIKAEKLNVGSDIKYFLENHPSKATISAEEDQRVWKSLLGRNKRQLPQPETPPLTPQYSSPVLEQPSSEDEAQLIPLLSDPSDFEHELQDIETRIFAQDVLTPVRTGSFPRLGFSNDIVVEDNEHVDLFQQINNLNNDSPPHIYEDERLRINDLKAEVPLTPSDPPHVEEKSITSASYAQTIPYEYELTTSPALPPDTMHIRETLDVAGEKVYVKLKYGEVLSEDALSRVTVPLIAPDEEITTPWKKFLDEVGRKGFDSAYHGLVKNNILGSGLMRPSFTGMVQAKDSVPWTFFNSHLLPSFTDEAFPQDDNTWKSFIDNESGIGDSTSQTWKPPGLRILDQDEDDEDDLGYGIFIRQGSENMTSLLKKRKRRMEQDNSHSSSRTEDTNIHRRHKSSVDIGVENNLFGNLLGGPFSAGMSVDNFMEIRGTKKAKLGESYFFSARPAAATSLTSKVAAKQKSIPNDSAKANDSNQFPFPIFEIPQEAFSIIASATVLKWSNLLKTLERTFPSVTIIERDFSAHNTTAWSPGSVKRSPVRSPLDAEADILVSPAMGVVMTTLAQAKSAPPPGHKGKSVIRERIERISLRYDKLTILVSGGKDNSPGVISEGLYPSDIAGLADFIAFTSSLDCKVITQYVSCGEKNLYQWLMAAIVQNRVSETLLSEQTHWELFLRRAGLNAFAAQSVISLLRAPDGVDTSSPSKMGQFGLTAFVEMGRHMRINRFGPHCGDKVLERVSDVIDAGWE